MEEEKETLKEEIKELKQENERLKQQLSKYTNPERYKIYYEKNKETILKKKAEVRSKRKNNLIDIRITTMTIKEISQLNKIHSNNDLANAYGLKIQTVSWEDTARNKGSCWGPNISDLTLMVENTPMNMIRKPNFSDITADIPHTNFTVTVGNETNSGNLTRIPLKEYVQDITKYNEIEGDNKIELWDERDDSLLISAQCCLLPSNDTTTHETEFCPRMYNYQSAVLVIVSTSQGTSSCILSNRENLYFNRNGRKVSYLAKRLKQDRKERGVALEGKMTSEEEDRNAIIIYQIPLKQRDIRCSTFGGNPWMVSGCNFGSIPLSGSLTICGGTSIGGPVYCETSISDCEEAFDCIPSLSYNSSTFLSYPNTVRLKKRSKSLGLDDAMLQVSEKDQGKFEKLDSSKLIRDTRFPIRVTYQFYKVTDTTILNESDFEFISNKINNIYNKAKDKGSLVLNKTDRPTEPIFTPLKISESQPALFNLI
jgi:hypothetical protein